MKIYRLDCSSNYRIVFQFKNHKLITRFREWIKHKRRVNRINNNDLSLIKSCIDDYISMRERELVEKKLDFNCVTSITIDGLNEFKNKLI